MERNKIEKYEQFSTYGNKVKIFIVPIMKLWLEL